MPRRSIASGWIPPLRPHEFPPGQFRARVWLNGAYRYCGTWGTPEAEAEHRRLIAEWLATGGEEAPEPAPHPTVAQLLEAFAQHAESFYRKANGKPSSELCIYRILVGYVNDLYGTLGIGDFRPLHLKAVRERFLQHRHSRYLTEAAREVDPNRKPWSRRQVNDHVRRVIRIFKWGVEHDFVPPDVLHRLQALRPLQRGRTTAPDRHTKPAIDWSTVEKTLPYLTRDAAALVQVLWLTGARSGELCRLCAADLDRSGPEWLFSPAKHKTAIHEKRKDIWFGKQAQAILKPYIDATTDSNRPLFSTHDEPKSVRWLTHYTPDSLMRTIVRGCRKAGVVRWTPKQLRSGRATQIEEAFSLDHAAAVLGDRLDTTRHHYSRAQALSRKVAKEMG